MTPQQLIDAAHHIQQRWPDALIYPNIPGRNEGVPDNAIAVDVDKVWPHDCTDDECIECAGRYGLVAWIDMSGNVHEVTP